jgi:hypothetical protein
MIMPYKRHDSGEVAIAIIVGMLIAAAAIVGLSLRRDGHDLNPPSSYPYHGQLTIGTNVAPKPAW